jgi:methanogenic corrinoid protein MtbC1
MDLLSDDKPRFNIKVVVNETGLKADTIRAWERRYGLPMPARSPGGHRQYSMRDVQTIKWLMGRQDEGLTISNAVDLWNSIKDSGRDPLLDPEYVSEEPETTVVSGGTIEQLREDWIVACSAFDEPGADQILNQAFAQFRVETVCVELLLKGLREIGRRWYQQQMSVQQEHFASELAIRRLESLLAGAPDPTMPGRILVIAPAGEEHTFSPLLVTLLLRRKGHRATFLGANVPLAKLDATIRRTQPELGVMIAQRLPTAASLLQGAELLNEHRVPVAYGGGIFNRLPGIRKRIPGHFLGESITNAPAVVEALLSGRPGPSEAPAPSEEYQHTLRAFERDQSRIEAFVYQRLGDREEFNGFLHLAISSMTENLRAGLMLGDISWLGSDIDWVGGLLEHQQIPSTILPGFLETYAQAVRDVLDDSGLLISEYLADLAIEIS